MPSRDISRIYNHLRKVKRYCGHANLKRIDHVAKMMHELPPTSNQPSLLRKTEFSTSIVILLIMTSCLGQRRVSMIATCVVVIPPPACLLHFLLRSSRQNYVANSIFILLLFLIQIFAICNRYLTSKSK
jgi:hypothetical protein